ncbi:MAG: hypothetical protein K0R57_246 [Paenibacillaceae bacterium]|jgi:uncharacterized protein YbjT (DUF2867 family)|nr:hypothetical protein [Paenibacillaceae bacterium]
MKVIVTGATGMVGEGVLHRCLIHQDVEQVLVISRKSCGISHPKLVEVIHPDFSDLRPAAAQLTGYDACFFCLGVSSVGMKEEEYTGLTYDLTMHMANLLAGANPEMVFCYVTGMSTDSSEQGKVMWARVKGRTENALLALPFRGAYMFRPGYIHPIKGLKHTHAYYRALSWLYHPLKLLMPNQLVTLAELGDAMIQLVKSGYPSPIINPKDIIRLAKGEQS